MKARHVVPEARGEVSQTILAAGGDEWLDFIDLGNCFQACVASLFDIPLADVPHFVQLEEEGLGSYWLLFESWCRARDWQPWTRPFVWVGDNPSSPCILYGRSPRASHVVVRRRDGSIWDPHPSRDGLVEITGAFEVVRHGEEPEFIRVGMQKFPNPLYIAPTVQTPITPTTTRADAP